MELCRQKKDDTILRLVEINFDDTSSVKQLGVVANVDLAKNKLLIQEEPFLQGHNYQKQRCDYCLVELEDKKRHSCENPQCIDIWC